MIMILGIALVWLVSAALAGFAAQGQGRNPVGWFIAAAALLTPLFAMLLVAVLPDLRRDRLDRDRHAELLKAIRAVPLTARNR
jgi:hypothetical protein